MEYVASALVLKERPHTTSNDNSEFRKVYLAISLTTDACKKGNILGMHFQIIDFFYDW